MFLTKSGKFASPLTCTVLGSVVNRTSVVPDVPELVSVGRVHAVIKTKIVQIFLMYLLSTELLFIARTAMLHEIQANLNYRQLLKLPVSVRKINR